MAPYNYGSGGLQTADNEEQTPVPGNLEISATRMLVGAGLQTGPEETAKTNIICPRPK